MSTFSGIVEEFSNIRIDNFVTTPSASSPTLAYFLSHVHTDHTVGLERYNAPAFIYCSAVTRELLLRLEKGAARAQFDACTLASRQRHFRRLRGVLRALPLNTPVEVPLTPKKHLRVTLLPANHCPGAVMFLLESPNKRALYTGDVRAEPWWLAQLLRTPALSGLRSLDTLYLDTTFAAVDPTYRVFPSKAEGLQRLLDQMQGCPADVFFHIKAWTLGYEDVLVAAATSLHSKIHVDRYTAELYGSLENVPDATELSAALNGFDLGTARHAGILSRESHHRIHTCDPPCKALQGQRVVRVLPILNDNLAEHAVPVEAEKVNQSYQEFDGKSLPVLPDIVFPFSRHSSYEELRALVAAFHPQDVHPCVFDPSKWRADNSVAALFGDLCSGDVFAFDVLCRRRLAAPSTPSEPWVSSPRCSQISAQSVESIEISHGNHEAAALNHQNGTYRKHATTEKLEDKDGNAKDLTQGPDPLHSLENSETLPAHPHRAQTPSNERPLTALSDHEEPNSAIHSEISDSQIALLSSSFDSHCPLNDRLAARQAAYRAVRNDDGWSWYNIATDLGFSTVEDVEL